MTITIKPLPGKSGEFGLITDSRAVRRWVITTSNKYDDEFTIRNYGQQTIGPGGQPYLPIPYVTQHPSQPAFLCQRLNVDQDTDNPYKWTATATFGSRPASEIQLNQTEAENPLLRRASFTWSTVQYQQGITIDADGKAIVNSAGDPYDPPVEIQLSRAVCSISKNVTGIPSWILEYENAINSDAFAIDGLAVPQYAARLSGIALSEIKREKIAAGVEFQYRVFTCKLEFKRELWYPLKVLDYGYRRYDPNDTTKRIPIYEDGTSNSRPVTTPRLLDGFGGVLPNPSQETAEFQRFNVYPKLPFNAFIPFL